MKVFSIALLALSAALCATSFAQTGRRVLRPANAAGEPEVSRTVVETASAPLPPATVAAADVSHPTSGKAVVFNPVVAAAMAAAAVQPVVDVPVETLKATKITTDAPQSTTSAKPTPNPVGTAAAAQQPVSKELSPSPADLPRSGSFDPHPTVQSGAIPSPTTFAESPEASVYEKEVARLQAIPPSPIPLRNLPLSTVIRAIAQHARMNYIAPNDADFSEQVTLRYTGNPWQILSILRRRHSFEMTYEDGIWSFYRPDQAELINRTYQLRYTTHLSVKAGAGAGASMGGQEPSANTAGGVAQNSQASTGGAQNIFESSGESLLKNIKTILGIPLSGADMQIAEGGMAGAMPEISVKQRPTVAKQREGGIKSEVIYLADSNQLFIIATRQQHQMIEEYLKRADRPEPLIRIDTRLVETTRDPKSFLGIDPSGWGHPTVKLMDSSTNSSGSGNSGSNTTTTQNQSNLTTPPFDLGKLSSLRPPNTAVLSMSDVSFQLNLLKQDATSRVTNEPRLVTTNNREVSIESVIQEPYASSSQSTQYAGSTSAVGGTTASQLAYTKIGTVINILPQIQKGANGQRIVNLHIVMTVSGKVSDKNIYGQLVPVTSARSYRYNDIQVPDGYTLAIGGLDETTASEAENKIPLAGDIPVVGYLFKSKSKENTRRNLIAYITPTILDFPDAELTKSDYRPLSAGELVPEFAKSKR